MATDNEPLRTPISAEAQRIVLLYAVLAGLTRLIPIPWLDDITLGVVSRRMVRVLLAERGLTASAPQVNRLSRERVGCPLSILWALLIAPLKKLVRTVVFVLAFKTCVDLSARWLHRGYLLAVAIASGRLDTEALARDGGVWPVALAIEESIIGKDTSPINQLVRSIFTVSPALLRKAARDLGRLVRPNRRSEDTAAEALAAAEHDEEEALSTILKPLSDGFWSQDAYLAELEALFFERLEQTSARMLS